MAPKVADNNKGRHNLPQEKKSCHQCRQKTANFGGVCKSKTKRNKGPCPITYCARCLLNRYGEQEVAQMGDHWTCPKCRGICNCSCCRKKRGEMPTGILTDVAKALGCGSVHHLLQKGSRVVAAPHVDVSLKHVPKRANNFQYEGADLIAPGPTKKRPNKKYIVGRPPLPRAADNVIPNSSQATSSASALAGPPLPIPNRSQATSSAGAQAGEDHTINAAPQFRLFGVDIQVGRK